MIRFILIELALFLLPFVVFYIVAVRAKRGEDVAWPWLGLSLAGLVIAATAFVWFAAVDGEDPSRHYQPAAEDVPYELSPDLPAYRQ